MRADITKLDERVASKEGELSTKIAELQTALDEAAKLLKRNSADLGAEVAAMRDELRNASGLVAGVSADSSAVRELITKLDSRMVVLETKLGVGAYAPTVTADSLWNDGKLAFEAGRYEDARRAFAQLVASFSTSDRADDAQYFGAEAYFKEKKYTEAIREFQVVINKFTTSSLADDALFRSAEAATALKNCAEARTYYGLLQQRYSSSSLVKKASDNDKALSAAMTKKDRNICSAS